VLQLFSYLPFLLPTTMAQTATLLVDDQDPQIQYLCGSLNQHVAGSYYNNTWTTVNSNDCKNGWFDYTFYGTGVHIAASVALSGASYSVKIDDGEFIPQSRGGAYDSPTLYDGKHTVTYALDAAGSPLDPPSFDYLTVTAGPSTPLEERTLAVDDADDSIVYSGSWSNSPVIPLSFDYATSLYRNTTHWSSTVGDTMRFKFLGSSISVFGIARNISSGGNITATYTLDGVSKVQSLPEGTLDSLPMVNLFHADVQPGIHTLIMNITDIQAPRALGIDFIAYNASFSNISFLPISNTLPSPANKSGGSLNAASKVGIAIGILAGVALLASLFVVLGRRYVRNRNPKFPLSDSLESGTQKSSPYDAW
jgi:hypothetical protein